MLLNCGDGEDSWESLGLQGDQTSPSSRKSTLNSLWKDWCWSWSSNTLATWCEKPTHWKWPWCWERLRVRGEGGNRGWDGWMASLTQWWIWASSGRFWRTESPDMLQSMGSQRVRLDWVTEQRNLLNSITEHLPSLNQDQHFQVSVTGCHQYPGSLRTVLLCTDTSHFRGRQRNQQMWPLGLSDLNFSLHFSVLLSFLYS